ncbi:MAG: hypothetical protein OQK97_08420 [Deltaproteobacteria bacterium]|nr:hypothetical protein [Deltaproteobacteria bacterium]
MYALGRGILKDYVKAYLWPSLPAENGHTETRKRSESLENKMSSAQIDDARRDAEKVCLGLEKNIG